MDQYCPKCGVKFYEGDDYCQGCGASRADGDQQGQGTGSGANGYGIQPNRIETEPISTAKFFGYMCLMLIPVVNVIALIILVFSRNKNTKNFGKAGLIVTFIYTVIIGLCVLFPLMLMLEDYNEYRYYNNLYDRNYDYDYDQDDYNRGENPFFGNRTPDMTPRNDDLDLQLEEPDAQDLFHVIEQEGNGLDI